MEWGGRAWTLDPSGGRPGLYPAGETTPGLLVLSGLAARDRRSDAAFTPGSLIGVEILHSRVSATYAPEGWRGLTVRAAWGPSLDGGGVDLEVQATTSTVGELRRLEILVRSIGAEGSLGPATIEPRDRASAMLSYDGREPDELLHRATTAPVPSAGAPGLAPLVAASTSPPGESPVYLELAHPHDVSRRIVERVDGPDGRPRIASARYALFGHDLEKGVVVRGRLRGVWLSNGEREGEGVEAHRLRFLQEPPPLGT